MNNLFVGQLYTSHEVLATISVMCFDTWMKSNRFDHVYCANNTILVIKQEEYGIANDCYWCLINKRFTLLSNYSLLTRFKRIS